MTTEAPTYTREQVSEAVNAAMDLITDGLEVDQETEDLLALLVNGTLTVLTSETGANLEDVIQENYGEDLDEWRKTRGI